MSQSRVTIYNRQGAALATVQCSTERSWVLNGEGLCRMTLSINDGKAQESLLRYGNFVTIEHPKLPMWAGVLDTDRIWGMSQLVLNVWSAERLLKYRVSKPLNVTLTGNHAGLLYKKLIDICNTPEDLRVRYGQIFTGGTPRDEKLDGKAIYDHVRAISARTGFDWGLEGAFNPARRLYFTANLYERRGREVNLALREGANMVLGENAMVEQGRIVNELTGVGEGSTDETRITYTEIETTSRGLYGLRQDTQDFSGNREMSTLVDNVKSTLSEDAYPLKTVSATALDVGTTFNMLRLGNIFPFHATSIGFLADRRIGMNTKMRVIGMKYSDELNQTQLVLQEAV